MPRRRYISTDISTDKRVAKLAKEHGDFAALLYTWMIPHAADDCTVEGDPEELLMLVVPGMMRHKSVEDVEAAVAGMVAVGLLIPEGDHYYFPPEAFYRYQNYVQTARRRPTDDAAKPHEMPQSAADSRKVPQNPASPSPSHSVTPSHSHSLSLSPSPSGGRSAVQREWESRIGVIPNSDLDAFKDFEAKVPEEWFLQAIDETCTKARSPSWAYCRTVLQRSYETGKAPRAAPGKAKAGTAKEQMLARLAAARK